MRHQNDKMITKILLAQKTFDLGGTISGEGPLGDIANIGNAEGAVNFFNRLISVTISIMSIIAVIWFLFILFSGAWGVMSAGGDKNKMESARGKITTGLIGLVIVIAGMFLVSFVGYILGLPILTPGTVILNVWG